MLEKLQKKFVALIMVCASLVLIVAFSVICLITYNQDLAGVNSLMRDRLEHAISADAPLSGMPNAVEKGGGEGPVPNGDTAPQPPFIGGGEFTRAQLTPVVVYEVSEGGIIRASSELSTALVSEAYLAEAVEGALAAPESFGRLSGSELLYSKRVEGNSIYVAFADKASVDAWKSLAGTLALVGLAVLGGFWVISIRFSRWALRPVEQAWAQQSQFIADASHELKTPLTVILANTAILQAHPKTSVQSQAQWIESTQREAERMQDLVNDMLELAQLEGENPDLSENERLDLSDILEGEMLQFESVAYERSVSIDGDIAGGVFVSGKEERLRRLVRTLIDNACKYSDEGSTIRVVLEKAESRTKAEPCAHMRVSSQGAVIEDADLEHIFDRFYRTDKSRSQDTGGHGLGLAIARDIAQDHGGDILASSSADGLTTFELILPLHN